MCNGGDMDRGIQATAAGLKAAKKELKLKGWTQEYLAGVAGCTRQTVSRFLGGHRIEKRISQDICAALDLNWSEIVKLDAEEPEQLLDIDELVETIRINIYDSIQTKCGSMRVLDMTQPIDLNAIYTNVNILEKITGRQRLEYRELMQSCSSENFDRFSLSGIQEARIPALAAVDKYTKLMILGKPGAGKTTFLKYVALQCIEGQFKSQLIPLFITLKDFAEDEYRSGLLSYIIQVFRSYGIEPDTKFQKGLLDSVLSIGATPIEFLLRQGRFAILLDGLDEVRESDSKRVLQQIQYFSNTFAKNLFAITCRIAAKEYTFEKFTEVEVADFDDRQIATFTRQWFQTKNDPVKAENFIDKLQQEPGIRDLASSPLLLTLLCLVFGESGSFPSNRSELYKEGLDVLLKKWDAKRNIDRDIVYKKLSPQRKEDLLSHIALDTFEQGKYFFKQKEAENYITQYIRNLPDAKTDEYTLQLDSEAVLKSIEAQHGIFVERARGIYSFSHLTFHEYFTARKISASTNFALSRQQITKYITHKRWREVILLTVGMLENADFLVRAMKQSADNILYEDEKTRKFLVWVEAKSRSIKSQRKPAAICAYNFSLAFALDPALARVIALDLDLTLDHPIDFVMDLDLTLDRDRALAMDLDLDRDLARALNCTIAMNLALAMDLDLDRDLARALNRTIGCARALYFIELHKSLQQMKDRLPDTSSKNIENFYIWWEANGKIWTEDLRSIAIEHRNIGHDWQFTEAQKTLLQQYYDANKLLVDCLNSDCYVSREVREEIESTLFLPIESIRKLQSNTDRSTQT
jgi:predicted NACHT family NTPase